MYIDIPTAAALSTTVAPTIAQQVAREMGDDGTRFRSGRTGAPLDEVCEAADGCSTTVGYRALRWDFPDGSSIVVCGNAWDMGLLGGCACWEGADHGRHQESCPHSAVTP